MDFLAIIVYGWFALLFAKALGLPLVKELTWEQLFLIPVVVIAIRALGIIGYILLVLAGIVLLFLFARFATGHLDLGNGFY